MIKVISFDMDGTLVGEDVDFYIWNEEIPKLYAEKYNLSLEEAKKEVYADYYKQRYIDNVKEWASLERWLKFYNIKYEDLKVDFEKEVHIYPEVKETLEYLKKYYSLIVVTNAHKDFMEIKLDLENLKSYFEKIYTSLDSNSGKKDKDLFNKIIENFNITNKEIIHVGDDPYYDKEVPESLGIKSYLLDREGKGDIKSLKELKKFLVNNSSK